MVLSMLLCLAGCEKSLPTAPSDLTTGIVVYEHANFLGESAHITQDISDLRDVQGPCLEIRLDEFLEFPVPTPDHGWNECISSLRVAPGWRATLYRDDGYRDDSLDIVADVEMSGRSNAKPGTDI
jgi:hypothetical protein